MTDEKKNETANSNRVKNQNNLIVWINEKTVFCFEKRRKTIDSSLTTNFKICSFQKNFQQLTFEKFNFFWWKITRSEKMKTKKQWIKTKKIILIWKCWLIAPKHINQRSDPYGPTERRDWSSDLIEAIDHLI